MSRSRRLTTSSAASLEPVTGWPPKGRVVWSIFHGDLTNVFSKKLENLKAACALHFAHYNFVCVHSSLRITPAMEELHELSSGSLHHLIFKATASTSF